MSKRFRLELPALVLLAIPRALPAPVRVRDLIPAAAHAAPITGRVYLALPEPATRAGRPSTRPAKPACRSSASTSRILRPGSAAVIDAATFGHPVQSLRDIPGGRVLGRAVRERVHEVCPRRRPHRLAAHGSVGRPGLETFAGKHLRQAGQDHLRSEIVDANSPRGRQRDPARPGPRRNRVCQADQDPERDPDEVVGSPDLSRRGRGAAQGIRRAPRREISGRVRRGTFFAAGPRLGGGTRSCPARPSSFTASGLPTARRG